MKTVDKSCQKIPKAVKKSFQLPKYPKDGKTCQKMAKVAKRWQMLPKV